MYFTRSLGIEEVHLCDHIGIGMNIGGSNIDLIIQNQYTKNMAVLGYVALYLCFDGDPRVSRCVV